ncbi:MAG: hypothetical protein AAF141_02865 [Pseudomonadota bacterium]
MSPARRARDTHTGDLFAWKPEPVSVGYDEEAVGRSTTSNKIARLLSRALREAKDESGFSREDIATLISEHIGRAVSKDMLDKFSSEASEDHRVPLDVFIALIEVTENHRLIGFIPSLFGFVAVDQKYEAIIQLSLLEEHEKELAAHKAALTAKMRGRR